MKIDFYRDEHELIDATPLCPKCRDTALGFGGETWRCNSCDLIFDIDDLGKSEKEGYERTRKYIETKLLKKKKMRKPIVQILYERLLIKLVAITVALCIITYLLTK
jgi:tRNA(Ile2) C34 agmatinyltransferase TiaS